MAQCFCSIQDSVSFWPIGGEGGKDGGTNGQNMSSQVNKIGQGNAQPKKNLAANPGTGQLKRAVLGITTAVYYDAAGWTKRTQNQNVSHPAEPATRQQLPSFEYAACVPASPPPKSCRVPCTARQQTASGQQRCDTQRSAPRPPGGAGRRPTLQETRIEGAACRSSTLGHGIFRAAEWLRSGTSEMRHCP